MRDMAKLLILAIDRILRKFLSFIQKVYSLFTCEQSELEKSNPPCLPKSLIWFANSSALDLSWPLEGPKVLVSCLGYKLNPKMLNYY